MGNREVQPIVRQPCTLDRAAHRKPKAIAHEHPRDVIERVRVAFAQFIGPENRRVVQQRAVSAGLGRLGQSRGQVGHFAGIPSADFRQLLLGIGVGVGLVRKAVLALINTQPLHVWLPNGIGVLQAGHLREIRRQRSHNQFDLHAADFWHLIVLLDQSLLQHRFGMGHLCVLGRELPFEFPHQGCVILQNSAILGRQRSRHLCEVFVQFIQHASHTLAILHLAVEFAEHLVGIVDRRDGLVGACVDHASPRVGAVGHQHAKFQRPKTGCRRRLALQELFDLLIDRSATGPTGGRVTSTLNISRQQFDARKQAAHASHVAIAVSLHFVVHALERQ